MSAARSPHIASRWGKEGIRCNAVAPGLVMGDTQKRRYDQRLQALALKIARSPRLGEPTDVAGTMAFLLSDGAEWVNGQVWSVCGGMSLRD